jgi:hypothetical protein
MRRRKGKGDEKRKMKRETKGNQRRKMEDEETRGR